MAIKLFLAFALVVYASLGFSLTLPPELNYTELAKLTNKELIVHSRAIPKRPWPEITIFAVIDVLPVEAAAVFSNYQDQKKYIPDLLKSYPVRRIAENEIIVDFEMRFPWPLSNSRYSTRNVFKTLENGGYLISWYMVESDSLIDTRGAVQFIPYGTKTLLIYKSLIYPGSKLAPIFSSRVKASMSKMVQAIVTYTEKIKKQNPEETQRLINSLPK
jgi:hypothetical protein